MHQRLVNGGLIEFSYSEIEKSFCLCKYGGPLYLFPALVINYFKHLSVTRMFSRLEAVFCVSPIGLCQCRDNNFPFFHSTVASTTKSAAPGV